MLIIIGLGNPGKNFKFTRHNLGFLVLDKFQKKNNFPGFSFNKDILSDKTEKILAGKKIVLIKPKTFMNSSGLAVKKILKNYKIKKGDIKENLLIIHDDIDLPFGKIKISVNKNSGGHKGVQSIIDTIKTKNFSRIRIGIAKEKKEKAEKLVLKNFTKEEINLIKEILQKTVEIINFFILNGLEKTMSKYN
ncbi:MAG: aminoacyl-tRNA hydrolase [Minisyncoccia bacterium]